ncbi:MAG: hypothetical protein N3B10_05640 [Armatimonadetes bacterium]|nr:hypothetical protein [Armatimonadota bacterium]MCX7967959.1 hypothetical protein [Armatimonadota bacterium]MDW8144200.1 hypothetical protein [Armatimonadota bacterium]
MLKFRPSLSLACLLVILGCAGNPFRQFKILDVKVEPTELPPQGGTISVEVEATRGDEARVTVVRQFGTPYALVLFTVKLTSVTAFDLEKRRWKGSIQLPPNHGSENIPYALIVGVRENGEWDERFFEVVVKAAPKSDSDKIQ